MFFGGPGTVTGDELFNRTWRVTVTDKPSIDAQAAVVAVPASDGNEAARAAASASLVILRAQANIVAQQLSTTAAGVAYAAKSVVRQQLDQQIFDLQTKLDKIPSRGGIAAAEAVPASKATAFESTEHDIKFKITKSIKSEPNRCTLEIYNLNEEQRNAIASLNPEGTKNVHVRDSKKIKAAARKVRKGITLKIEAGYAGQNSLLWLGDMRTAESEFISPNWVTKFSSGDGEKAWQNARVNVSYGPKTPVSMALRACVKALGLGDGNVEEILNSIRVAGKLYTQGTVLSGPVRDHITDFCRSADMTWSIQDGTIQFVRRGKALANRAIKISVETGMLGSPKRDIDNIVTVKTMLIPDIRPGRLIVIEAKQNEGNYRVEQIIYDGDSAGSDWGLTLKAVDFL